MFTDISEEYTASSFTLKVEAVLSSERSVNITTLLGVICQETVVYILIAVKTSYMKYIKPLKLNFF
jgi:hypothetical protein